MRRFRLALPSLLLCVAAGSVWSQPAPPPPIPPPAPSEAAPTPPPPLASDADLEPQVTIVRRENETQEVVRIGGEIKFVRVTPRTGRPYYLVPRPGGTTFIRRDSLDSGLSVPLWLLFSW